MLLRYFCVAYILNKPIFAIKACYVPQVYLHVWNFRIAQYIKEPWTTKIYFKSRRSKLDPRLRLKATPNSEILLFVVLT